MYTKLMESEKLIIVATYVQLNIVYVASTSKCVNSWNVYGA